MPAPALIRDSFFGKVVYRASGRRLFQHAEERPGFILPKRYRHGADPTAPSSIRASPNASAHRRSDAATLVERPLTDTDEKRAREGSAFRLKEPHDVEKGPVSQDAPPRIDDDPELVDWYGPDDPESPMNWSFAKRCFVTFDICIITFAIYIGSAIYSPGTMDVAQKFGISNVAATLGLTMFVIGYGIGPMVLSPLSEIPQLGRTSVYLITLILFVIIQVPTVFVTNLGGLLPLRFLAGFVGSPPLATGGASLADMWAPEDRAVVTGLWGLAAVCGPVLGPLLGAGFVTQANGWTWTIWVLLWLSGGAMLFLLFFLPETSSQAILYRRAVRLRRLTGNDKLRSAGERESANMTLSAIAQMTLIRPFVLGFTEPIVACWNLYIALVYGILYIFIESFAVVFVETRGFNLGENGLTFLGQFVGVAIAYAFFVPYATRILKPKFARGIENFIPEDRLPPAMLGALFLPVSLFWFGWTSEASIHWVVPIAASAFFSIGTFLLFQAGLNYLQDCYPRYVASVLAGNDFFRATLGAAFPLFSTAFFHNLGVGPACSVLGGITVAMVPIPWVLYRFGAKIRAASKNTGGEGAAGTST